MVCGGNKRVEFLHAIKVINLKYTVISIRLYNISSKHHGNHKTKIHSKYTEDKNKGIKVYTMQNYQFIEDNKRGRKEEKTANGHKTINKMAIVLAK